MRLLLIVLLLLAGCGSGEPVVLDIESKPVEAQ